MLSCTNTKQNTPPSSDNSLQPEIRKNYINTEGRTIGDRFIVPTGYKRKDYQDTSFGHYIRNFKLLPDGNSVHLYNGQLKGNQTAHAAILDIDVGNKDLQQCADATMRLRLEYLYKEKRYDEIGFQFTNGWHFDYLSFRNGKKMAIKGNKTWWAEDKPKTTKSDFRNYLDQLFMYAGTLSLSKETKSKPFSDIEIGDIFIQGGSPGHAVIVVDVAIAENGVDKAFLIAQSYMPAQQIHILKNPNHESNWYFSNEITVQINTPEWTFTVDQLKSF